MPAARRASVVVYAAPGTLAGVDRSLRRAGVLVARLASIDRAGVDPARWLPRLARGPVPDAVIVSSRAAVDHGVGPWRAAVGPRARGVEFWAVGPGTAGALRRLGIRRVRRPRRIGSVALAAALGRSPPRRLVYFRSDRAGGDLGRSLRRGGHRVIAPIVYRVRSPRALRPRERQTLESAALIVVSSPSGLASLRERLGARRFSRLARATGLVVLGARSARAARRLGFRRVSVAPSTAAHRFTRHLLRELGHADA